MTVRARHFHTGRWVELGIEGRTIAAIADLPSDPNGPLGDDLWVAPAFWDLQTNGRWGISFNSPTLSVEQVCDVVRAHAHLGTARLCPTLISADDRAFQHGIATIAAACEQDRAVADAVLGIHLEGPYLSDIDGYRGAHPAEVMRDPDWNEFQRWQELAGGRITLVTLAPEREGTIPFIRRAVDSGVTVALGHTAADGSTLRAAADAGARLSTHLGNGISAVLPRHPNPIWHQAALDNLNASLIADGHHVDLETLRVLVRAKTPRRVILVSDHSPLAGLPPGQYGPWAVESSGKVVVAGTTYLAGSNQDLDVGISHLLDPVGLSLSDAIDTVTRHPAALLGKPEPALGVNQSANLVLFRRGTGTNGAGRIRLERVCVDGRWVDADPALRRLPEVG